MTIIQIKTATTTTTTLTFYKVPQSIENPRSVNHHTLSHQLYNNNNNNNNNDNSNNNK